MAFNSNTMEFFRRLENNGTGSSKLGKIITTSKAVGSIASGSILSSNLSFPAFIDSLFGSGDDMAMDVSPVRFEESSGEYIVDPTIVSHREVDEDGNPVEPNFKIKLEVTPGSDLIECINIQKIVTTTDPETGDSVSKKITVSTIKTAQASAPSETGVNDFIITVPCTKEDAAADEVKLRVVAYEYIIAPNGPAKPTPLPDEKPSNGQPSKVVEIGVTFGALQLTKAKLTSTQSSPVTNVVTGTSIDFPLTGEVVIGEDGLALEDLVSLELFKDGVSTPVATAADPAAGDKVTYTATVVANASAPDRKVSVPYTLVATWPEGVTKEATFTPTVVAKEITTPTTVSCVITNPSRTNVLPGTIETFTVTATVNIGDDGRSLDNLGLLTIEDEDGVTIAEATDPTTGTVTGTFTITADPSAPSKTVSKTVVGVAYWGESESDVIPSTEAIAKVVAKEISQYTTCVLSTSFTGEVPASPSKNKDCVVTAHVVIGEDGLKLSDITKLSIQNTFDIDRYVSDNPTSGTITWTDTLATPALGEGTFVADYKLVAEFGPSKKIESEYIHVGVIPTVLEPAQITYTIDPVSPQTGIEHDDDVVYTIACTVDPRDEAKYATAACVEKFLLIDADTLEVLNGNYTGGTFTGSLEHTMYADVRATDRKTTTRAIAQVYWDESSMTDFSMVANPTVTAPFDLVVVAKTPENPVSIAISSTTASPASAAPSQSVSFPLTAEITFGDDGYVESEVVSIKIYEGSTVIATSLPGVGTYDLSTYTITSGATVGGSVTKTVKAVAEFEDGKTITSNNLSLVVNTANGTTVNLTADPSFEQTNVESGTNATFTLTGSITFGADGRTLADLDTIHLYAGDDIVADESVDLTTGKVTGTVTLAAKYAATGHKVSQPVSVKTTWKNGLSNIDASNTVSVVAKTTNPTTIAVSSTQTSPVEATGGTAVTFPLTATITLGNEGYTVDDLGPISIYEGSTVIATASAGGALTFSKDDYAITASTTIGTTVSKSIKATAAVNGETVTSDVVTYAVKTIDVTKVNMTGASTKSDIEHGTTVSFEIEGEVVIGGDGRSLSDLTSIDIMYGETKDSSTILTTATKDLAAGTISGTIELTADYSATDHSVSKVVYITTRWNNGFSALESTLGTIKVVAKAPEKHVYVGIMHLPYEASLTYDEGMGADALTPIPAADMTDENWPTEAAIAADINSATGHPNQLPLLCAGDESPNPIINRSVSWHIDPETEQWAEGSVLTEAVIKETRDPVDVPAYAAEIHAGRQAFITSKHAFTLDSAEVAQMHTASGFLFDLSDQKEAYYCDLTDDEPYDPNDPGFTPSTWGLAKVSWPVFIIPTEDFNKDFFTSGGYETELVHFDITIDGIPYTAYFGKGGTASFIGKTYKVKISDK